MSKGKRLGLVTLAIGGVLGFVISGAPGLVFAAVCLVAGLVMLVLSEARGTRTKVVKQKNEQVREAAHVLVLLKEIHARPQRNGKFQEIGAPDESGLEFEMFLNCWLLNETDLPLHIVEPIQLTIGATDGSHKFGERVSSALENWRLGSVVKDEWNPDRVRAAQEKISELNTTEPLECGVPRQGWLHFRFRDISSRRHYSDPANTGSFVLLRYLSTEANVTNTPKILVNFHRTKWVFWKGKVKNNGSSLCFQS